jgi:hypothetical protein
LFVPAERRGSPLKNVRGLGEFFLWGSGKSSPTGLGSARDLKSILLKNILAMRGTFR